jgi:ATP-dependent exoDNAse (exonuclease V) beta subunit
MILEISTESIRDIAAAVNAARKREPDIEIIAALERKVLVAIQQKSKMIELETQEAQSLRNVLMQRAYDQRRTTEATDYSDLADRISNALESEGQLITLESEQES